MAHTADLGVGSPAFGISASPWALRCDNRQLHISKWHKQQTAACHLRVRASTRTQIVLI